jgi:hypothetical protein
VIASQRVRQGKNTGRLWMSWPSTTMSSLSVATQMATANGKPRTAANYERVPRSYFECFGGFGFSPACSQTFKYA